MIASNKAWLGAAVALISFGSAWAGEIFESEAIQFGAPIAQDTLDARRAGEARIRLNLQETTATLKDNKAINTVTGSNFITGNAFRDSAGLPTAVQNTGNNVIVQNAFIINLDVK